MSDKYRIVRTTPEVWAVIRASHPDLKVFGSYSDPNGCDSGFRQGKMFTSYGFEGGYDFPIMQAETTWDIAIDHPNTRLNQKTEYWLCIGVAEEC